MMAANVIYVRWRILGEMQHQQQKWVVRQNYSWRHEIKSYAEKIRWQKFQCNCAHSKGTPANMRTPQKGATTYNPIEANNKTESKNDESPPLCV